MPYAETEDLLSDAPDMPPLYAEICSYYIDQIFNGRIKPGQLLPPARKVAEQHGVSQSTARRGIRLLSALGWARAIPGYPYQALRPKPE